MKLDKEQQKHFAEAIRNASKKKGFKVKGCSIYVLEGNAFIHCDYFVDSQKMFYRIYIKNYEYDDIFWKVLQMPSNSKQADSLRAVGAFKAPSILIEKGEVELTENYEELAESLVELIMECSHDFMKNYDIDEYVVNNAEEMNIDILKYLAYIHMNRVNESQVIAEEAIKSGKVGSFKNGGKSFFEWAIMAEWNKIHGRMENAKDPDGLV